MAPSGVPAGSAFRAAVTVMASTEVALGEGEGEVEGEVDELPDESWTVDHKVGELLGV